MQQWDYYYKRFLGQRIVPISTPPSEYFYRNIYATFFNDAVGGQLLSWWGQDNCMWSTDYPHPNSPWPNSRQVLQENLGQNNIIKEFLRMGGLRCAILTSSSIKVGDEIKVL